jgi:hypothetical protein
MSRWNILTEVTIWIHYLLFNRLKAVFIKYKMEIKIEEDQVNLERLRAEL